MSNTIHASNIAADVSEQEVRDFFSFCGKISSLSLKPVTADVDSLQSATVTFESSTAAKTAHLLDKVILAKSEVRINAAKSLEDLASNTESTVKIDSKHHKVDSTEVDYTVNQEDKPRARIIAEYMAAGYVVAEKAIQQAIAIDEKHGFSAQFVSALRNFDASVNVSGKAASVNQKFGVGQKTKAGWHDIRSCFDKALDNKTGLMLREFYAKQSKQVSHVHNEAKHLASMKLGSMGDAQPDPSPQDHATDTPKE